MTNRDIEVKYIETYEAWTERVSYQFRIDFQEQLKDRDSNNISNLLDLTFNPYKIIVFTQIGKNFVEGFFDSVDKNYNYDKYVDLIKKSIDELDMKVNSATIKKNLPKIV